MLCAPFLTLLLAVPSLFTIFVVLGLSGGIFITLSIAIVYIFKLIQVYTRYSEYTDTESTEVNSNVDLVGVITKNAILVMLSTSFSLLILFVLIMNFIFSVYSVQYGY